MRGAEGIVLGCTEFPLIIKPADVAIPVTVVPDLSGNRTSQVLELYMDDLYGTCSVFYLWQRGKKRSRIVEGAELR